MESDTQVALVEDPPITAFKRHLTNCIASISVDSSADAVLELRWRLKFAAEFVAAARKQLDEVFIQWLEHNGSLEVSGVRYYVGPKKTTKCLDSRATLEAILTATGGDLERTCEVLASGCWKHGAAKKVFELAGTPEMFDKLFEVVVESEVAEGKPVKRLNEVDKRFLR